MWGRSLSSSNRVRDRPGNFRGKMKIWSNDAFEKKDCKKLTSEFLKEMRIL